jgi:hypothetical protein
MAFLLAAILVLAPFVVLFLAGDPPAGLRLRARSAAAVGPTAAEAARCEVEGLLARRLLAGEIDRAAYHDAMAELAVRDARARPLHVPGDPPGAGRSGPR